MPKKVGKPLWTPTPEILKKVETLAAQGLHQYEIADCIGVGRSTLFEKKNSFPEFQDAIQRGQSKGMEFATNMLLQMAKEKHFPAVKYYLSCRGGERWRENSEIRPEVKILNVITDKGVEKFSR